MSNLAKHKSSAMAAQSAATTGAIPGIAATAVLGASDASSLAGTRWVDGMLVPGPPAWNVTGVSAPRTSGLVALPLFAIVAQHIYDEAYHDEKNTAISFLEGVFDSMYKYHDYLHTERAADGGLVFLYHPWESELPTTLRWRKTLLDLRPQLLPPPASRISRLPCFHRPRVVRNP